MCYALCGIIKNTFKTAPALFQKSDAPLLILKIQNQAFTYNEKRSFVCITIEKQLITHHEIFPILI